jgi:hypothetical protein
MAVIPLDVTFDYNSPEDAWVEATGTWLVSYPLSAERKLLFRLSGDQMNIGDVTGAVVIDLGAGTAIASPSCWLRRVVTLNDEMFPNAAEVNQIDAAVRYQTSC